MVGAVVRQPYEGVVDRLPGPSSMKVLLYGDPLRVVAPELLQ